MAGEQVCQSLCNICIYEYIYKKKTSFKMMMSSDIPFIHANIARVQNDLTWIAILFFFSRLLCEDLRLLHNFLIDHYGLRFRVINESLQYG
jgi:hypothetical protein